MRFPRYKVHNKNVNETATNQQETKISGGQFTQHVSIQHVKQKEVPCLNILPTIKSVFFALKTSKI